MENPNPMVTHSRFFSNEFNTAIIDGPLRIYFADRQESDALQIYFHIQESLAASGLRLDSMPLHIPQIFLMLYPTKQTYFDIFSSEDEMSWGQFGDHQILGVSGPCADKTRKLVTQRVRDAFERIELHGFTADK